MVTIRVMRHVADIDDDKAAGGTTMSREAPQSNAIIEHSFSLKIQEGRWGTEAAPAESPMMVQRGEDPSIAVIAFKGFGGALNLSRFEFLAITGLLSYSRILLRDDTRTCYLAGLPPFADDVDGIAALLQERLRELAPQKTIVIGPSGGSHAAMLFGHLIGADYVHAFSPYANLDPDWSTQFGDPSDKLRFADAIERLRDVPDASRKYYDLRNVLRDWNGKTAYNIHVCAQSAPDVYRASLIDGLPGVSVHRHGCGSHRIVTWLAARKQLIPLLRSENQADVAEIVRGYNETTVP